MTDQPIQRALAEQAYADELDQLARNDRRPRPPNWRMSPWAVATYLLGGTLDDGFVITPKYIGNARVIDALLARSNRAIVKARLPAPGRVSGLADLGLYDSERDDDELLTHWRDRIDLERPPVLAALDAWEAWVDLAPLQTMPWLGPLLVAAVLRAGGKTAHHLACVSLGLRESRRAKGGSTLHGYAMAPPKVAMLNAIKAAAEAGLQEHDRLMLARTQLERFLTNRRSHSRLPGLVELVLAKPLVTPQLVAKELRITARGALDLIGALSPTLKEVTGRGRYRAWAVR